MTAAAIRGAGEAARRWNRRLDEIVDFRAAAVARILLGSITVLHLWPFVELAVDGVSHRDRFFAPYWSWYPEVPESVYFALLYGAVAAAVLLTFGLFTKPVSVYLAAFVGYNLFFSVAEFHHNRAFLLSLLIGLALMPVGRALSVDAVLGKQRAPLGARWPLTVLRYQLAAVYVASGFSKLIDPDWWGGLVLQLRIERFGGEATAAGLPESLVEFAASDLFSSVLAKAAVGTELAIGLGLLWSRTRLAAIWLAVVFHVSIEVFADVQVFSYAALAALFMWVTPRSRDRAVLLPDTARGRRAATWIRRLDWSARFRVATSASAGAITLEDRGGVVRSGADAMLMIATRLPATFMAAAPFALIRSMRVRR